MDHCRDGIIHTIQQHGNDAGESVDPAHLRSLFIAKEIDDAQYGIEQVQEEIASGKQSEQPELRRHGRLQKEDGHQHGKGHPHGAGEKEHIGGRTDPLLPSFEDLPLFQCRQKSDDAHENVGIHREKAEHGKLSGREGAAGDAAHHPQGRNQYEKDDDQV